MEVTLKWKYTIKIASEWKCVVELSTLFSVVMQRASTGARDFQVTVDGAALGSWTYIFVNLFFFIV